jgi:hypothetical protein
MRLLSLIVDKDRWCKTTLVNKLDLVDVNETEERDLEGKHRELLGSHSNMLLGAPLSGLKSIFPEGLPRPSGRKGARA